MIRVLYLTALIGAVATASAGGLEKPQPAKLWAAVSILKVCSTA
jgi:hypothetical protein